LGHLCQISARLESATMEHEPLSMVTYYFEDYFKNENKNNTYTLENITKALEDSLTKYLLDDDLNSSLDFKDIVKGFGFRRAVALDRYGDIDELYHNGGDLKLITFRLVHLVIMHMMNISRIVDDMRKD